MSASVFDSGDGLSRAVSRAERLRRSLAQKLGHEPSDVELELAICTPDPDPMIDVTPR